MADETIAQDQVALKTLLEVEVREAWFRAHPGAKEDGAVVGVHRAKNGKESWMKTVDGVTTEIGRAEYNARAWWAEKQAEQSGPK